MSGRTEKKSVVYNIMSFENRKLFYLINKTPKEINARNINLPPLLMELIKHCCDRDPSKRPIAWKLGVITEAWSMNVGSWGEEYIDKTSEFYRQYEQLEINLNKKT